MSTKKRFYIQQSNPSYRYLRDGARLEPAHSVHTVFAGLAAEVEYQQELCDPLNKGWEATQAETRPKITVTHVEPPQPRVVVIHRRPGLGVFR